MATLERCFAAVGVDGGRIALIAGEAGIGKTSVLRAFARSRQQDTAVVGCLRCAADAASARSAARHRARTPAALRRRARRAAPRAVRGRARRTAAGRAADAGGGGGRALGRRRHARPGSSTWAGASSARARCWRSATATTRSPRRIRCAGCWASCPRARAPCSRYRACRLPPSRRWRDAPGDVPTACMQRRAATPSSSPNCCATPATRAPPCRPASRTWCWRASPVSAPGLRRCCRR